eukprot:GEZU01002050.1.p1 GENE.GEZU01002050.1~~GEZU01002050.1.p1  ORF type:complete len:101 (-),score=18.68 GEZU01002050.1:30-332(-)
MASPLSSFVVAKEYHVLKQLLQESDRIQDLYRFNSAKKVIILSNSISNQNVEALEAMTKEKKSRKHREGAMKIWIDQIAALRTGIGMIMMMATTITTAPS